MSEQIDRVQREKGRAEKYIRRRLPHWQKILRLSDWEIFTEVVRSFNFDDPTTAADCTVFQRKRRAHVRFRNPADYTDGANHPDVPSGVDDLEYSIVHELLHIHFDELWKTGKRSEIAAEQAIHALATTLLRLTTGAH